MLAFLEKTNSLSLWIRVVITSAAIGAAYFLQNPRRDRGTGRALSPLGRTTGFLVVAASRLLRPIAALIRKGLSPSPTRRRSQFSWPQPSRCASWPAFMAVFALATGLSPSPPGASWRAYVKT
jgi:hypothetical protein